MTDDSFDVNCHIRHHTGGDECCFAIVSGEGAYGTIIGIIRNKI